MKPIDYLPNPPSMPTSEEIRAWLAWNDGTVRRLIWKDLHGSPGVRDYWPLIADALEEAGCCHAGLLAMLRGQPFGGDTVDVWISLAFRAIDEWYPLNRIEIPQAAG